MTKAWNASQLALSACMSLLIRWTRVPQHEDRSTDVNLDEDPLDDAWDLYR
jgi:hypothetical protein